MNSELIRRWNERVRKEDLLYFLGDFCFKNSSGGKPGEGTPDSAEHWKSQLNGHITFIRGNHDKNNSLRTLATSCVINFAGEDLFLTHRPDDANTKYKINLVGHCHERWHYKSYNGSVLINVGVDVNGFYPKTIEETLKEYKHWMRNNVLEEYVPWKGGNA